MITTAIIQARMGSSRLPGKMMLHLGNKEALTHVIDRVKKAKEIDEVIVATSEKNHDVVIAEQARESGVSVYRGDGSDVLGRMFYAAVESNADNIIRINGDCSFVSPEIVDYLAISAMTKDIDYISNKVTRTFPLGLDVEVFTMDSFELVHGEATAPHEREHVTPYYLENSSAFSVENVTSDEIFTQDRYQDRTDIELVLDEAADYFYLDEIYSSLPHEKQDIRSVIDYIDAQNLTSEIESVSRKTKEDTEQDDMEYNR